MAFTAGMAIMTVEILGGRILAPYFGGSIYIWGSIITVFLVALSIGYLSGGHYSLKQPSLRKYGYLFMAASLSLLPIILFTDPVINVTYKLTDDPRYGSLIASVLLFFFPGLLMGMISPYSIRLLVKSQSGSGHTAGILYFISTFGSALGTLGTSFYFVLYFEVNHILLTTLACLFIPGILCMLSNWQPNQEPEQEQEQEPVPQPE
jgi:hypothetical protein